MASIALDTSTDPQVGFRPPGRLDPATALLPYGGHFGPRQAAHLLRRAGFGGSSADIMQLAALGAPAAVESLMHPAGAEPAFPDYPATSVLYGAAGGVRAGTERWWLDRMLRTQHVLVEKMTLFWHGHFATSIAKVPAPLMARQIDLFRAQGLGNFRTLLGAVAIDPAMSVWLDNRANSKAHPNENFAREVMELFALGLGNFSETDVKEAARALTGWPYDGKTMSVSFNPRAHDDGSKTLLGRTGDFGLTDVVDIIVQQPVHQRFLGRKLLEFFVYSDPEPELTEALAQAYALAGYDIAKTVGTLLRSNVFYSTRAYRAMPKSPIEFVIGLLRLGGAQAVPANVPDALRRMGQEPLAPPSVKGWDGGPSWINTNTLLARFNFVNALMATARSGQMTATSPTAPATLMSATPMSATPALPTTATRVAAAGIVAPNIAPDAIVQQAGGLDPERIVAAIIRDALQDDVTTDIRRTLLDFLNSDGNVPGAGSQANAVAFGPENYQAKIRGAFALTLNLPVNQLN